MEGRDHMLELHFRARTDAMITTYFNSSKPRGCLGVGDLIRVYLRFESPDALKGVFYEIGPTVSIPVFTKRKYFFNKRNTFINCEYIHIHVIYCNVHACKLFSFDTCYTCMFMIQCINRRKTNDFNR